MKDSPASPPSPFLKWLCISALVWAVLVLQAGGFTTSIRAGMAFLDWPLSNGSLNPTGWLTEIDKFAEHSHRLAATGLGLFCIAIAWMHHRWEKRPLIRKATYLLLGLIIFQGLLGGLRVLLDQLNIGGDGNLKAVSFAIGHAVNAQLTIAVLAIVAMSHTKLWQNNSDHSTRFEIISGRISLGLLLSVILMGAVMRQNHFTLWATQPTTYELFIPNGAGLPQVINSLHRGGALIAGILVIIFALSGQRPAYRWIPLLVLLTLQITLGILSIQLPLNPHVRTVHLVIGAALFSTLCAQVALTHRRN
jgi:cytochrome c oxidase assembly protein subunit 15